MVWVSLALLFLNLGCVIVYTLGLGLVAWGFAVVFMEGSLIIGGFGLLLLLTATYIPLHNDRHQPSPVIASP